MPEILFDGSHSYRLIAFLRAGIGKKWKWNKVELETG